MGSSAQTKSARPESNLYSLYQNCDQLPLDRFINILIDDDLKQLIITGEPPMHILAQAWIDIYFEYYDTQSSIDGKYKLQLLKEIALLECALLKIETILHCLSYTYSPELHAELVGIGYECELDPHNIESYRESLQGVKNRSREIRIDIKLKQAELETLQEAAEKEKKVERSYFTNHLSRIATYKKVAVIKPKDITVAEFSAMCTEYLDYINNLKKRANHGIPTY